MTQYIRPSDGVIMNLVWDAESVSGLPEFLSPIGNDLAWMGAAGHQNRLISIAPAVPASGDKKIENIYDGQSRRVQKTVSTYNGSSWDVTKDEKFLYDGWNLAAVYNAANSNVLWKTFTWGLDIAEQQGADLPRHSSPGATAGGVGGLLSSNDGASYAYTFDANGNVSEVINSLGSVVAHYEYDPFGNTTVASGAYATTNVYRFSTKHQDNESGFLYYGYRFYDPALGRWPNRDPIGDLAFTSRLSRHAVRKIRVADRIVQYVFVQNNALARYDYLGLAAKGPTEGAACSECEGKATISQIIDDGTGERVKARVTVTTSGGEVYSLEKWWWTCTWGIQDGDPSNQDPATSGSNAGWKKLEKLDWDNPVNSRDPGRCGSNSLVVKAKLKYMTCKDRKWVKEETPLQNQPNRTAVRQSSTSPWTWE